jgi:hypothetical protein
MTDSLEVLHFATLSMEQLDDIYMGPVLWEVETGEHPEWKDFADCSPTHEDYWAL